MTNHHDNSNKIVLSNIFIGSREEIEVVAERLDKEMNTDLESDCEAVVDVSKTNRQQPRQNSTTTTVSKTSFSKANTEIGGSTVTKNNNTQQKNDTSNLLEVTFSLTFGNVFSLSRHYTNKNTIISFN
jgi:hypothetical protein